MSWGLGPVFRYECVAESRRWQFYAARTLLVGMLLLGTMVVATTRTTPLDEVQSWSHYARLGEIYFCVLIGIEMALVMLVAPAATAGAVCLDRSRGNLQHAMVTDLSNAEIVLGKLAARLLPVLTLIGCTWPVLALCSLLGGIDPLALALAFGVMLAVALVGCSMAIGLSVCARKPHEVVLAVYLFWLVMLLAWPLRFVLGPIGLSAAAWYTWLLDPFMVAFAPYLYTGLLQADDYMAFFGGSLLLSAMFVGMAVWRIRAVAIREGVQSRRKSTLGWTGWLTRILPGPSLDRNPVLWREWHRSRPSWWMVWIFVLFGGTTIFFCVGGAVSIWRMGYHGSMSWWEFAGYLSELIQVAFGLVMIAAIAPLAMSEERQRGSLDLLASTTLSTREIVVGKWLGTARFVPLVLIGPAIFGLATIFTNGARWRFPGMAPPTTHFSAGQLLTMAAMLGAILTHGALYTSLGLFMAIVVERPSRATVMTISACVFIVIGLPIVALAAAGMDTVASLSPIYTVFRLSDPQSGPWTNFRESVIWPTVFWDLEVATLAAGLVWLSIRVFDECMGRVAERPRLQPFVADVVVVYAAMLIVACLCMSIRSGLDGIELTGLHHSESTLSSVWLSLAIGLGLILTGVVAAWTANVHASQPRLDRRSNGQSIGRTFFADQWKRSFGLLLLIAAGPALLSCVLATTSSTIVVASTVAQITPGKVVFGPLVPDKIATVRSTEAGPTQRTCGVAMLIVTILSTGATMMLTGTAAGFACTTRRWSVIVSALAGLGFAVGWSVLALVILSNRAYVGLAPVTLIANWPIGTMSLVGSASFLLEFLMSRLDSFGEHWWAVIAGNVINTAVGMSTFWWMIHKAGAAMTEAPPPHIRMAQTVLE